MAAARTIGALFLAGFLTYGIGFALVTSAIGADGGLTARTTLVVGALLMLLNVLIDVGKGVLFFGVLERHGRRTALLYLTMMAAEAVLLGLGVLFLLLLVPLHDRGADPVFGLLATDANNLLYQIGEFLLGFTGVFLCALLARARLVPRVLAWWGAAGYVVFAIGTVAELFGAHVGLALSIPGGLFEVALGIWLIVRGFARVPSQGAAGPVPLVDERLVGHESR
ncbi:DUF4386 domain-containing protein [Dactylosporangium sp. NPDC000244]|uniref:DUF4386 domain-containing protein n=1 Tax=Dactylosporangium sp. NPDC000244 TaxID=3154365 RepID=UPI0033310D6D